IRTMFDYQVKEGDEKLPYDKGTVIDCIYYSESNNNRRNSKPPLAAWAVYNIYKQTNDIEFLKEMYPKLVEYHNWWYTNRDVDKNGVAEFGAMVHPAHYLYDDDNKLILDSNGNKQANPQAVIEAAAWESGMDNATRFDIEGLGDDDTGVLVYENKDENGNVVGYSINQESVDLNSFLYAEKAFLKTMAEALKLPEDAKKYEEEAKVLSDFINNNMFDKQTGFYYDLQTNQDGSTKKLLVNRGKGTEGWLPLWAKLATKSNAEMVKTNMMDEGKFNTKLPFPTASADNKKFAPTKYWRGPVWLDQALFGVEALQNYGYTDEAKAMTEKLFNNAGGLLTDGTIHENYNPRSGDV
ncbi:MAG: trehalase family glycosidase, partial [Oscillospiraceae bacterium]